MKKLKNTRLKNQIHVSKKHLTNQSLLNFSTNIEHTQSTKPCNQPVTSLYLSQTLTEHREYLLNLIFVLDGIIQSPKYHPESDALYHTLQVFECAHKESNDPELWLAALFHDVGKSVDSKCHCKIGVEMVFELFPRRVLWLIEHHIDLTKSPQKVKKRLANTQALKDLILLRKWDLAGREIDANVREPEEAFDLIVDALGQLNNI